MKKEQIEHKLEEALKRRQEIFDNILWLKEQVAEFKRLEQLDKILGLKPKLQHGDLIEWYPSAIKGLRLIWESLEGHLETYNNYGKRIGTTDKDTSASFIKHFNIFDLMEGWGEPFEGFRKYGIRLEPSNIDDIFIDAGGSYLTISQSEEYWRALGHLIVARKRAKKM